MESRAQSRWYQCLLWFFHSICLKHCACHKVRPGHGKCCACHAKSFSQIWPFDAPKRNLSRNLWWRCHLYRACHATCIFVDPLQMSHAWFLFNYYKILTFCLTGKVHNPLRLPQKMLIERPKVVRASGAFSSLTSKCASRHNGVRFCWTSELPKVLRSWRVLNLLCFQNVLRATTPRTFSTSQLPKVFQAWFAFSILTWKFASHPSRVHFFHSTSRLAPNMLCFVHVLRAKTPCIFQHVNFNFQKCSEPFSTATHNWLLTGSYVANQRLQSQTIFEDSFLGSHWARVLNLAIPGSGKSVATTNTKLAGISPLCEIPFARADYVN